MIVFDNHTPTGRNVGPVHAYPRYMGASLHTEAVSRRVRERATDKSRRYARLQDAKNRRA